MRLSILALSAASLASAMIINAADAQNYPTRPIKIVTTEPGSGTDLASRLIAQALTGPLGQQVIVDNRAGLLPGELVAKAQPDGYTLLLNGPGIWLEPYLRDNLAWNPTRDFAPITLAVRSPNVVVVHPSVAVRNVAELISLAKSQPGVLNYGSGAAGNSAHLAVELFKSMAGVNIVRVVYKGVGPALTALVGGQVQLMFPNAGSAAPYMKSGRLKALAVTSPQPSPLVPGIPTVSASGLPGYESIVMFAIFAPAATPTAIVNRLNHEIVQAINAPDVKEKFFNAGMETVGSTPEQFTAAMKAEMTSMGKLIKDAGIRDE